MPSYQSLTSVVHDRATRSIHLLQGIREALVELDQPALIRIADLVHEDATAARRAVLQIHEERRGHVDKAILADLESLSRLAGPAGASAVMRTVNNLKFR